MSFFFTPVFIYQLQTICCKYEVEAENSVTLNTANCFPPQKADDPKTWFPFKHISKQPQHSAFLTVARSVSEQPNKELVVGTCARSCL
jgi:hypothetical protein